MDGRKFRTAWIVAGLLVVSLASAIPTAAAEESDNLIWGVGYEWANLNTDVGSLTGVSIAEMLGEFSTAADYAGFNMTWLQVSSGESEIFVEQWNDDTIQEITDGDGDSHFVTTRMTELTVRHGTLLDVGLLSDWADENATYALSVYGDSEMVLTMDILYTEYVNADLDFVGADMAGSMNFELGQMIGIDLFVVGGNETLDWDVELDVDVGFEVTEMESTWRLNEPSNLYSEMIDSDKTEPYSNVSSFWCDGVDDNCNGLSGSYSTVSDYSISLTGLPADEIGLDADAFDLVISDSFPDSGTFNEVVEEYFEIDFWGDGQQVSVYDSFNWNTTIETGVAADHPPFSPFVEVSVGYPMGAAFDGSSGSDSMADAIEAALENWVSDVEESVSGNDTFVCDDGNEIPASWVNDGENDCTDGSDEGVDEEEGPEDIFEEKLMEIASAFGESNFEKTMEAFGEKLESLLSGYEADMVYTDGEIFSLWSDDEARFIGMQMLVETGCDNCTYALIGPESAEYESAPTSINVHYYVGSAAEDALANAEDADTLEELAPVDEHDLAALEEMLGIADEGDDGISDGTDDPLVDGESESGGLLGLPGPSLVSVVFVVLGAAMVATIKPRRREE